MESLILKSGKLGTPVKDRRKFQAKVQENFRSSENANPNVSQASPAKSPMTKSAVSSPLVKSSQKNQIPNPRNRIIEKRFVVVAKKDLATTESTVAEIDCKCGERKGNMKCVCVAYETLRASQEEVFRKRSESEEEKGGLEECDNLGQNDGDEVEGEASGEHEQIGVSTMNKLAVSSSWDSSHDSVLCGSSNAGRRSRRNSLDSTTTMGSRRSEKKQVKVTSLKPFNLRTEQRGHMKEEEFSKKLQEIMMEEENMRIPVAQGLPWTTDEPEPPDYEPPFFRGCTEEEESVLDHTCEDENDDGRSTKLVKKAIDDAGLQKSQINEFVLVGGSTRIPNVKDEFEEQLARVKDSIYSHHLDTLALTDVLRDISLVQSQEYTPPSLLTRHHITESTFEHFFDTEVTLDQIAEGKRNREEKRKKGNKKKKKSPSSPHFLDKINATNPVNDTTQMYGINGCLILWQITEPIGLDLSIAQDWTERAGAVRNQYQHAICWIYVATDLVSCWLKTKSPDQAFVTLSARYIATTIDRGEELPLITKPSQERLHSCFGSLVERALQFMKDYGVPQEDEDDENDFCCVEKKEFKYQVNKYDNLDWDTCSGLNIQMLIQMLSNQPVGASLQIFTPDFRDLKPGEIYYGPQTEVSTLVNLHAVIIVAVIRYKENLVAKCKSSYGTKCNDAGYIYVSLTTMLYASKDRNPNPSSLFTRLVVLK